MLLHGFSLYTFYPHSFMFIVDLFIDLRGRMQIVKQPLRPEANEFFDSKPSVRHQVSPVRIRLGGFLIVNMDKKPIVLERDGNFYPVSGNF